MRKRCEFVDPESPEDISQYDGRNNNLKHPNWGSVGAPLQRRGESQYSDGISKMAFRRPNNPNPRIVSNTICASKVNRDNPEGLTNLYWAFLQFIDHTLDLTTESHGENVEMVTPPNDPILPNATIPFVRSIHKYSSGTSECNPREQVNLLTSYLDGGNIYGFDQNRADALREHDGTGYLKTSTNYNGQVLPPLNTHELPNAILPNTDPKQYYLAGDIRANENVLLLSIHGLFVREHNLVCDEILERHPKWFGHDDWIYEKARKIVTGKLQWITYNEALRYMFGSKFKPWTKYNPKINTGITTEFSTVAFRLGHTMLPEVLTVGKSQKIELKNSFFNPQYVSRHGIDKLLEGGWNQLMKQVDPIISESIRSHLFGSPIISEDVLLDLAAINIQRGRDHGILDYNSLRKVYGLPKLNFNEISSEPRVNQKLKYLYKNPDSIDPWIGGLCECPVGNGLVGPLFRKILKTQFQKIRDGDRFWFENDNDLVISEKEEIKSTYFSDIIRRNTQIHHVPKDVFHLY